MSDWEDAVANMDSALMAEFSVLVTLHLDAGDSVVNGIFDDPSNLSSLGKGGQVVDSSPTLHLTDAVAADVEKGLFITIGSQKWQVVKPPLPDGTGMTKITLGHTNGTTAEKPTVSYRS